jgi:Na+-transporting methylmalonyl-CoA/oxaloacetate decarboxylase gamma subunit
MNTRPKVTPTERIWLTVSAVFVFVVLLIAATAVISTLVEKEPPACPAARKSP